MEPARWFLDPGLVGSVGNSLAVAP